MVGEITVVKGYCFLMVFITHAVFRNSMIYYFFVYILACLLQNRSRFCDGVIVLAQLNWVEGRTIWFVSRIFPPIKRSCLIRRMRVWWTMQLEGGWGQMRKTSWIDAPTSLRKELQFLLFGQMRELKTGWRHKLMLLIISGRVLLAHGTRPVHNLLTIKLELTFHSLVAGRRTKTN